MGYDLVVRRERSFMVANATVAQRRMTVTGHKDVSVFKSYHVKRKAAQAEALRRYANHLREQQQQTGTRS